MSRSLLPFCALFLGAILAAPNASAIVRRDDVPDSEYRRLGEKGAFKSVVRVQVKYRGSFKDIGTATLLPGGRLLSSAHVFDDSSLRGARAVRIRFGHRSIPIHFERNGVINLHPRYNPFRLKNDVAVIFLDREIHMKPAQLYHGKKIDLGTPITFVGFGLTGTGLSGQKISRAIKRAGQNALDRYLSKRRFFEVDFDSPYDPRLSSMGDATPLAMEALLGSGDSGGSVWVRRGGKWKLIGINTYGVSRLGRTGRDSEYGEVSGFTYIPRYERWMKSLHDPFSDATFSGLSALQPVPEPSTWLLLGAGGMVTAGALLRRRR